eukprot:901718-Pleurochrysis_carterae.AAC.1
MVNQRTKCEGSEADPGCLAERVEGVKGVKGGNDVNGVHGVKGINGEKGVKDGNGEQNVSGLAAGWCMRRRGRGSRGRSRRR